MTDAIVAATASRISKTVMHLDTTEYYTGGWASFNLEVITKLKQKIEDSNSNKEINLRKKDYKLIKKGIRRYPVSFRCNSGIRGVVDRLQIIQRCQ